jgi:hypothetical protein
MIVDENVQSMHIGNAIEGIFRASSPYNIKSGFFAAGIRLEVDMERDPRIRKVRPGTYCKSDRRCCTSILPGLEEEDPAFLLDSEYGDDNDDAYPTYEIVPEGRSELAPLQNGEFELREDFLWGEDDSDGIDGR